MSHVYRQKEAGDESRWMVLVFTTKVVKKCISEKRGKGIAVLAVRDTGFKPHKKTAKSKGLGASENIAIEKHKDSLCVNTWQIGI